MCMYAWYYRLERRMHSFILIYTMPLKYILLLSPTAILKILNSVGFDCCEDEHSPYDAECSGHQTSKKSTDTPFLHNILCSSVHSSILWVRFQVWKGLLSGFNCICLYRVQYSCLANVFVKFIFLFE